MVNAYSQNTQNTSMTTFKALVANEIDGQFGTSITELSLDQLPDHDVLVRVDYSTLNYKDGLAVSGKSKICKRYPMVFGIDLAGEIVESASSEWSVGDKVLVNGYGLSENHWGGYSEYQRLKPEWLVRVPDSLTTLDTMAIGTAGYTAMLCVLAVQEHGVKPADGPVLVTGASGGVGSFAITLLTKLGYEVVAVTGSESEHAWLKSIGASSIMAREEFSRPSMPMEAEQWPAVIDSVGGQTLACVISQTRYNGVVAACGLAGGFDLPATVMPFILRNVRLQGVDSVNAPIERRQVAWKALGDMITAKDLEPLYEIASLEDVPELAAQIMAGTLSKRRVIKIG